MKKRKAYDKNSDEHHWEVKGRIKQIQISCNQLHYATEHEVRGEIKVYAVDVLKPSGYLLTYLDLKMPMVEERNQFDSEYCSDFCALHNHKPKTQNNLI